MEIQEYRFDKMEFAGSLGDLGTLIPLSVALVVVSGLSVTSVLLMAGIFYVASGLWFKLPIPVQPLKVVAAIAIAYPGEITVSMIGASGVLFGLILILLAWTGFIHTLARLFTRQIIRGIQLGLGFLLISKGIGLMCAKGLFLPSGLSETITTPAHANLIVGFLAFGAVLLLINSRKFPAALVIVVGGVIIGALHGAFSHINFVLGPSKATFLSLSYKDLLSAFILLVIPQIPLTIGNAVIGTTDTCAALFGKTHATRRANNKGFAMSMGIMNILAGLFCAMPMCHGAGGLAAHYRFGARTGGSNIMIGIVFIIVALFFGKIAITLLTAIPASVLGVMLVFAGLELALLIRDVKEKNDLFIVLLIAGIALATSNMATAFIAGIIALKLIEWRKIKL